MMSAAAVIAALQANKEVWWLTCYNSLGKFCRQNIYVSPIQGQRNIVFAIDIRSFVTKSYLLCNLKTVSRYFYETLQKCLPPWDDVQNTRTITVVYVPWELCPFEHCKKWFWS